MALFACTVSLHADSLQQDMELANVAHIQATRELDAVRSQLRDAESLHPIQTEQSAQLRGMLRNYESRLRVPNDRYSAAFADFAQAYRRAFWDPLEMDPEGQTRLALALFHASTLRRKDETWLQNLRRLSGDPAYPLYRGLWMAMGWYANTLEREGGVLMEAEHTLRQTQQTIDAEIRADSSIFEAGGGWVRSLEDLRNSVGDAENELRQTAELIASLRRDERDLLERQTQLQSRLDQLAEERRRREAGADRAELERRHRNEEIRRRWEEQQAHPQATPNVQVKVDPAFVEADEPQGPAGLRTRTYRFYLLAEETANTPAKLRLNWLRTDPLLPHRTAPSAYTRRPDTAYSLRPGEVEPLRAWEEGDMILSLYALLAGVGPDFKLSWAGGTKHLGPFYLTSSEREKYWGAFTAEIEVFDANDRPVQTLQIEWEPFPRPAQERLGHEAKLSLSYPDAGMMEGSRLWHQDNRVGGRRIQLEIADLPADLPEGLYWFEIHIERVGTMNACAFHRQGQRHINLLTQLPFPKGEFNITIRSPQLPGMPLYTLPLRRVVSAQTAQHERGAIENSLAAIARTHAHRERFPASRPKDLVLSQRAIWSAYLSAAAAHARLGEYREASELAQKASAAFPAFGHPHLSEGEVNSYERSQATMESFIAFESADLETFRAATRRWIRALEAGIQKQLQTTSLGSEDSMSSLGTSLGDLSHAYELQADRLLVLTGDLRVVEAVLPRLREIHQQRRLSSTYDDQMRRLSLQTSIPCFHAAILASDAP